MTALLLIPALFGLSLGLLWAWLSLQMARQIPAIPAGHRRYAYRLVIRRAGHSAMLLFFWAALVVEVFADEDEALAPLLAGMVLGLAAFVVTMPWWGRHDPLAEAALQNWALGQKAADANELSNS